MLLLFVCMKAENVRILFTHQDNWDQTHKLLPGASFNLPLLNMLTIRNQHWKKLKFSVKACKINNLLRIRVFHDNRSGAWENSLSLFVPGNEHYHMLLRYSPYHDLSEAL